MSLVPHAQRAAVEGFIDETPEEEREPFVRHLARLISLLTHEERASKAGTLAPERL